MKSLC